MNKSTPLPAGRAGDGYIPEQAQPKQPRPADELRQDQYDRDAALTVFENCLLTAATAPVTTDLSLHPLMLVQAAKALVGLRPDRPSQRLISFALELSDAASGSVVDRDQLTVSPDQLGLTVSVGELELAIQAGDLTGAQGHLARLRLVAANSGFLFDVLLDVASRRPEHAQSLTPFVHYAQRAADFVGVANQIDFFLPALAVVVQHKAGHRSTGASLLPWDALPYLDEAHPAVVTLAAHAAQIMADDHVKGAPIQAGLGRSLAALIDRDRNSRRAVPPGRPGTVPDLISAALAGDRAHAGALACQLGAGGDRGWILALLETVPPANFTPQLLLWADAFRMLYRCAPAEHFDRLGQVAGVQLTAVLKK